MFLRYPKTWNDDSHPPTEATDLATIPASGDEPTGMVADRSIAVERVALICLGMVAVLLLIAIFVVSRQPADTARHAQIALVLDLAARVSPAPPTLALAATSVQAWPVVKKHVDSGQGACGGAAQPPRAVQPGHPWRSIDAARGTALQPVCSAPRRGMGSARL